jgi:small multidrug resistance family-3 protein
MRVLVLFVLAGLLEIGGGYLVWQWFRGGRGFIVGAVGMVLLAAYGIVPALQPREHPFGRVYAAYGAVFIVLSVLWGWAVDGQRPDLRDWVGATVALTGAIILMWPRAQLALGPG